MISAIADGESRIHNYSTGADCHSTLGCVRALGIEVEVDGTEVRDQGQRTGRTARARRRSRRRQFGLHHSYAERNPGRPAVPSRRIFGDESLSRRPMQRIMRPLAEMGAEIRAREDKFPPLEIHGARLRPIDYTLPVPSAQVKTCVLFAGLFAEGQTTVSEPVRVARSHRDRAARVRRRPHAWRSARSRSPDVPI